MGVHFTFKNQAVMKFFLAIFAVLAVANAQESCDLCKMGVDALGQYLMTEAEIAAVEEGLVDLVCSTLDEEQIQTCAEGVYTWWPSVTEALFAYEGTDVFANTVYNDLHGAVFCDDTTYVPAANTEECKGLMDLIGVKAVKALGTLLSVTASRICVDLGCTA